ncbi:MAG: hypothetical protein BJ554DRAFT_5389, partial [Olpidium bornovanus]
SRRHVTPRPRSRPRTVCVCGPTSVVAPAVCVGSRVWWCPSRNNGKFPPRFGFRSISEPAAYSRIGAFQSATPVPEPQYRTLCTTYCAPDIAHRMVRTGTCSTAHTHAHTPHIRYGASSGGRAYTKCI